MKVRSMTFPSTNVVPSGGGDIYLSSEIFDTRNHIYLSDKTYRSEFNFIPDTSSETVFRSGGEVEFQGDATEVWVLNRDILQADSFSFVFGVDLLRGEGESFFGSIDFYNHDTGSFASITFEESQTVQDGVVSRGEQLVYSEGEPTLTTMTPVEMSEGGLIRVDVQTGHSIVISYFDKDATPVAQRNYSLSSIGIQGRLRVGLSLSGRQGTRLKSGRFTDIPVIYPEEIFEGTNNIDPGGIISGLDEGAVYLTTSRSYPRRRLVTSTGIGKMWREFRSAYIDFKEVDVEFSTPKFLIPYKAKVFSDDTGALVCRPTATPGRDNQGSLSGFQRCVCDGSPDEEGVSYVRLAKHGYLRHSSDSGASKTRPEFVTVEPGGGKSGEDIVFGQSLDLLRCHLDPPVHNIHGVDIEELRVLQLENGDRLYYGYIVEEKRSIESPGSMVLRVEAVAGGAPGSFQDGYYELYNMDERRVEIGDEVGSVQVDRSSFLRPGRKEMVSKNLDYTIYSELGGTLSSYEYVIEEFDLEESYPWAGDSRSDYVLYKPPYGSIDDAPWRVSVFDLKPPVGRLVAYLYERCTNQFKSVFDNYILDELPILSTIGESLTAVQLSDEEVVFLYNGVDIDHGEFLVRERRGAQIASVVLTIPSMLFQGEETQRFDFLVSDDLAFGGSWPEMWYRRGGRIFAFDAVAAGQELSLFMTLEYFDNYMAYPSLSENVKHIRIPILTSSVNNVDLRVSNDISIDSAIYNEDVTEWREEVGKLYEWGFDKEPLFYDFFFDYIPGEWLQPSASIEKIKTGQDLLVAPRVPIMTKGFERIRATGGGHKGEVVLSLLANRTRCPLIVAGGATEWESVIIPAHFNFLSGGRTNVGHYGMRWTNIKSLSASYANDGMIYTVASRGVYAPDLDESMPTDGIYAPYGFPKRNCEMGVVDRDREGDLFEMVSTGGVYMSSEDISEDPEVPRVVHLPELNLGRHSFRTVPILNFYKQDDPGQTDAYEGNSFNSVPILNIDNVDGYMVTTAGSIVKNNPDLDTWVTPQVFQSFHQDNIPFEVPLDEVFIPGYRDYSTGQADFDGVKAAVEPGDDLTMLKLSDSSVVFTNSDRFSNRYKVRLKVNTSSTDPNLDLSTVELKIILDMNDPSSKEVVEVKAIVRLDTVEVRALILDPDNLEEIEVTLGKFCDVDLDKVLEFNFLVERDASSRGVPPYIVPGEKAPYIPFLPLAKAIVNISVVLKEQSGNLNSYNFANRGRKITKTFSPVIKQGASSEGSLTLSSGSSRPSGDTDYIYEAGWGSLTPVNGFLSRDYGWSETVNGRTLNNGLEIDRPLTFLTGPYFKKGSDHWRDFSDTRVIHSSYNSPDYNFRVGERAGRTRFYHFEGGVLFGFRGEYGQTGDTFTYGKVNEGDFGNPRPLRAHGNFRSSVDEDEMILWMDSHDLDLPAFEVDAFAVRGVNVPDVDLVVRQDESSPWVTVDTLDLRRYTLLGEDLIIPILYDLGGDPDEVYEIDLGEFPEGHLSEVTHYLESPLVEPAIRQISDLSVDRLRMRPVFGRELVPGDTSSIFSSRGGKKIDNKVFSRFVGIRLRANGCRTNERAIKIESFGFGKLVDMPEKFNHSRGTGLSYSGGLETRFVFDEQPYQVGKTRLSKSFELAYNISDERVARNYLSIIKSLGVNKDFLWIFDRKLADFWNVYTVILDSGVSFSPIIGYDGEIYHEILASFRSIE